MTFIADVPLWVPSTGQVIVKEAHESNYGGYGRINEPRALVIHTPEEDAGDNEITPRWFQNPDANASTTVYTDDDGDLFQIVPEIECAWANGVKESQRIWKGVVGASPPWRIPGVSYNCVTLSNEVEGRAHSIPAKGHSEKQWTTLVNWCNYATKKYGIPVDRDHIVGHYEIASHKTDPGGLDLDALVLEVLTAQQPQEPLAGGVTQAVLIGSGRFVTDAGTVIINP